MLNRDEIIEFLKDFAYKKDYVYAMWLEGADGVNRVDEYSDIDFWFDVEKTHQESFLNECLERLKVLGNIDSQVNDIRKEIAQSNIHLENTSEYLTLDICVQSHQIRGKQATEFVNNDIAERPKVIFDKKNIISYIDEDNLEQLADDLGLTYVHMDESEDIDPVLENVMGLLDAEEEETTKFGYADVYFWFVYPLAALVAYEFISVKRRA